MQYSHAFAALFLVGVVALIGSRVEPNLAGQFAAVSAATSCIITASATSITAGAPVTLSWNSTADSAQHWLYGIYPDRNGRSVPSQGSIDLTPGTTTVFTFKYTVSGSVHSCAVRVTVKSTAACTFDGTSVAHGTSVTAYQSSQVPEGGQCVSETRTCSNGVLSGTYPYRSCTVGNAPPAVCAISVTPAISFGTDPNTISWSSPAGSTAHRIYGVPGEPSGRVVAGSGSFSVIATTTRYFTLRYSLNGAYTTCSALLTVPFFHSPTTVANPKSEIVLGLFGQSFSEALYADPARSAFARELNEAGYPVTIVFHGSGGSSALKEHAPVPDRYWWDLDAQKPGPQLNSALNVLKGSPKKPTHILWLQGEGDSVSPAVLSSGDRYYRATAQVLWALKREANPSQPNSILSFMHVIGRRLTSGVDVPGVQFIRNQQLSMIDRSSLDFLVDTWDLPLLGDDPAHAGNSHMNDEGNTLLGWRAAQVVLASLGEPADQAPYVVSSKNLDGKTIRLQFRARTDAAHSVLTNPARPSHIAVQVGTTIYTSSELSFRWVNTTTLDISIPTQTLSDITVLYPYGGIPTIDRANIIKDGYGTPIRAFSITRKAP